MRSCSSICFLIHTVDTVNINKKVLQGDWCEVAARHIGFRRRWLMKSGTCILDCCAFQVQAVNGQSHQLPAPPSCMIWRILRHLTDVDHEGRAWDAMMRGITSSTTPAGSARKPCCAFGTLYLAPHWSSASKDIQKMNNGNKWAYLNIIDGLLATCTFGGHCTCDSRFISELGAEPCLGGHLELDQLLVQFSPQCCTGLQSRPLHRL